MAEIRKTPLINWKDGSTPETGTLALGSNVRTEVEQLYENDVEIEKKMLNNTTELKNHLKSKINTLEQKLILKIDLLADRELRTRRALGRIINSFRGYIWTQVSYNVVVSVKGGSGPAFIARDHRAYGFMCTMGLPMDISITPLQEIQNLPIGSWNQVIPSGANSFKYIIINSNIYNIDYNKQIKKIPRASNIISIANHGAILLSVNQAGQLYKTTNDGYLWKNLNQNKFKAVYYNERNIFIAIKTRDDGHDTLVLSKDFGESWEEINHFKSKQNCEFKDISSNKQGSFVVIYKQNNNTFVVTKVPGYTDFYLQKTISIDYAEISCDICSRDIFIAINQNGNLMYLDYREGRGWGEITNIRDSIGIKKMNVILDRWKVSIFLDGNYFLQSFHDSGHYLA